MDLFHDPQNYPEHILMLINMIIYQHQKGIEQSEDKSNSSISGSQRGMAIWVLIFCLVACYVCWLDCSSSVKCNVK